MNEQCWFPQRSSTDNTVAVLRNLIYYLDAQVTKTSIEQAVALRPSYPAISFWDLNEILSKWQIESLAVQIKPEELSKVPLPAIAFYEEEETGFYVLIYELSESKQVQIIHPRKGWIKEPLAVFAKKWNGAIFIAEKTTESGEENYEHKRQQESIRENLLPKTNKVRVIKNFFSEEECAYVINLASPLLKESETIVEGKLLKAVTCTNQATQLATKDDEMLNRIYQKAARYMGNIPEAHIEYIQCVAYTAGEEYRSHYDAYDTRDAMMREEVEKGGQRMCTFLVYLNDDFEGGCTYFPVLDMKIKPEKGTAIFFYNVDANGAIDKEALHAGLCVTGGKKYACTLWIRDKAIRKNPAINLDLNKEASLKEEA